MKKGLLLVFGLILFGVLSIFTSAISEVDCIRGLGQWIVPSFDKEPFCQCGNYINGHPSQKWSGTNCVEITQKDICLRSNGIWQDTECVCKGGEWIPEVGCQFVVHESNMFLIVSIIVLFILVVIAIIYLIRLTKNKKRKIDAI